MASTSVETVEDRALELAGQADASAAVSELVRLAEGDRATLELARNRLARRLHGRAGDWKASLALGLLNRSLVEVGWTDPYDWKIRWSLPFRRP